MEYHDFDVRLRVGRQPFRARLRIPSVPLALPDFLPIVNELAGLLVRVAEKEAQQAGRIVACGPGCGACCRQLVPVSTAEAVALRGVLSRLEPAQRRRIKKRFRSASERLRSAGMEDRLRDADDDREPAARRALGLTYFALGIACPFLEDESCSIYGQRPLACREYLVTSDPAHCREPEAGLVETVEMPQRLSGIFRRFASHHLPTQRRWVPLISLLDDRVIDQREVIAARVPGPLLMERFLAALSPAPARPRSEEGAGAAPS